MIGTEKKLVVLRGRALSLITGESALVHHDGKITRTSAIVSIQAVTPDYVRFETRNSLYYVMPVRSGSAARLRAEPVCA